MSKEIQKKEIILPGGFCDVLIASTGQTGRITSIASALGSNCVTITINSQHLTDQTTEDADYEVIEPLQLSNNPLGSQTEQN